MMKIEFVDFYKTIKIKCNKKLKNILGTVHIYLIEEELDIRGILVIDTGRGMIFCFPHFYGIDEDTGKPVRYPHVRFMNEAKHKAILDFLHQEVKPIIKKRLSVESK